MKTHAFPYQLAQEAILLGRYADAIDLLKPLSQNDDPDAQFLHAYLHFWDDNLSRIEALDRMTYLANTGHAEANYILAICPDLSPGYQFSLPKRDEQLNRLKMAAELGSVYAMTDLAQCHIEGLFNHSDLTIARQLLEKAFELDSNYHHNVKNHFLYGVILVSNPTNDEDIQTGISNLWKSGHSSLKYPLLASSAITFGLNILRSVIPDSTQSGGVHFLKVQNKLIERFERIFDEIHSSNKPQWQNYLYRYCTSNIHYDLQNSDFDNLTDFVFDHYIHLPQDVSWVTYSEIDYNPVELLRYYTELFKNPDFLLERYSNNQVIHGLERISYKSHRSISRLIFGAYVDTNIDDAIVCIYAIESLFANLLHKPFMSNICYEWWRNYNKWREKQSKYTLDEMAQIQKAELKTILQILNLNSLNCQKSAICGIRQINFAGKAEILQKYIDDHPDHPAWILEYARAGIEGRV